MNAAARALAILLAAAPAACVRLVYSVQHVEDPLPPGAVAALQPGVDDLGSCLRKLGAPHFAWEYRGDGMALGWIYSDASGWSFELSYAYERLLSASFSLDLADTDLPGAVLWFDEHLRLLEMREGRMRELTRSLRRRPAPVDG